MNQFVYRKVGEDAEEQLSRDFEVRHGSLTVAEFEKLFEYVAGSFAKFGSFSEGSGSLFTSSRYVDPQPWIRVVPRDGVSPAEAVRIGLSIASEAPRPFGLVFDYDQDFIAILPGKLVVSTLKEKNLK
jgi:hypothetical protein